MSDQETRVVIVGGGWRVSRFVVPALMATGVRAEEIVVVRRSRVPVTGYEPVRVVQGIELLPLEDVKLTINCVPAQSLQRVQQALMAAYRRATHFCDTPVIHGNDSVLALTRTRNRLFALEDWPLLPNLAFLAERARAERGRVRVRIEHFGIPLHFLAWYRCVLGRWRPTRRQVTRLSDELVAWPRRDFKVSFRSHKILPVAKASIESPNLLIEDFHEIERAPHEDGEVLYRVVAGNAVRYYLGADVITEEPIPAEISAAFQPFEDRKNVHELDKVIALTRLFRSSLGGGTVKPYPVLDAARDTLTARRLETRSTCRLR